MENKQTSMQVLKSKIQDAIGEMNGELSLYESGYKQCLINIQNDIDAQMMELEKEQITDSFGVGCQVESTRLIGYQDMAKQYYNETYGKETDRS